jgi:hypothetical protein
VTNWIPSTRTERLPRVDRTAVQINPVADDEDRRGGVTADPVTASPMLMGPLVTVEDGRYNSSEAHRLRTTTPPYYI